MGVPKRSRATDDLCVQHDGLGAPSTQAKQVRFAFALGRDVRRFFVYSPARVPQSSSQDTAHDIVPKNAVIISVEALMNDVRDRLG